MEGDKFENISNSVIATRGSIAKGLITVQERRGADVAEAIRALEQAVSGAHISEDTRQEALELLGEITGQAAAERAAAARWTVSATLVTLMEEALSGVELPPDLLTRLQQRAAKERRTVAQMAEILLEDALAEPDPPPAPKPPEKSLKGGQSLTVAPGRRADDLAAALANIKAAAKQRGLPLRPRSLAKLRTMLASRFTEVHTFEDARALDAEAWLQAQATVGVVRLLFHDDPAAIAQAERLKALRDAAATQRRIVMARQDSATP